MSLKNVGNLKLRKNLNKKLSKQLTIFIYLIVEEEKTHTYTHKQHLSKFTVIFHTHTYRVFMV